MAKSTKGRFKKGTNDADGSGKKGGSLSAEDRRPENADELAMFNLGRQARMGGIKRGDSPYIGAQGEMWRRGWDYQDRA